MATEDIFIWDGTDFVSIQGKPGQSPVVDPNCDVSAAANCTSNPNAAVTVTYKDANGDTTLVPDEAVSTNLKFGFTLVPGCDGTTVTEDTGNHTANKLLYNQSPTVTITDAAPGDPDELKLNFAFGLPQGEPGTGITIKGSVDTEADLPDCSTYSGDEGDMYIVALNNAGAAGHGFVYNGKDTDCWDDVGQIKGQDGKEPVFNAPTVSNVPCANGNPGTATATIVKNDIDSNETSNVYDVSFGIPEGCSGSDGKNAQVIKQATEPTVDSEGDPVRLGCIWIKTN